MALHLTSKGLLARAKNLAQSEGPVRSSLVSSTAAGVGLAAGKRGKHDHTVEIAAVVAGAGLNVIGMHGIGDGAMAGGATLLGYKFGVKQSRPVITQPPVALPRVVKKKKGFFR